MVEIFGLGIFENVMNWFTTPLTIILFLIVTCVTGYFFYKHNFNRIKNFEASHDYSINIVLILFYGLFLFWVSKYLLHIDLIFSLIITAIFYSVSIFVLTVTLIILRRRKIKKYCIESVIEINKQFVKEKVYQINVNCMAANHKYTDMLKEDIIRIEKTGGTIDINKYKNIDIWQDKNQHPKSDE